MSATATVCELVWFAGGKQRPAHEWVRPAYLAFNFLGFAMPFLVIRDGNSAFGAAALWHAVQYIAIVWLYNDRRTDKLCDSLKVNLVRLSDSKLLEELIWSIESR